jgi:hypothetical protein
VNVWLLAAIATGLIANADIVIAISGANVPDPLHTNNPAVRRLDSQCLTPIN